MSSKQQQAEREAMKLQRWDLFEGRWNKTNSRGWVTDADAEAMEARCAELNAENARLREICSRAHGLMPTIEGSALAFVDSDIVPHVMELVDDHAALREQVKALAEGGASE